MATIVSGDFIPGIYIKQWDASQFPSGPYIYSIELSTDNGVRLLLIRKLLHLN